MMARPRAVRALIVFVVLIAGLMAGTEASTKPKDDKKNDLETTGGAVTREQAIAVLARNLVSTAPKGQPLKLAVLDLTDLNGGCSLLGRLVAEEMTTALAVRTEFEVIERNRLLQILTDMSQFAAPDPETYALIQQSLGVEYVVVGTLTPLDGVIKVSARLIATNTGRILTASSAEFKSDRAMARLYESRCSDSGKRAGSSAGRKLTEASPIPRSAGIRSATADGWEGDSPPQYAIDGSPQTFWHTNWKQNPKPYPHAIVLELGTKEEIAGVRYLPRQDHPNGRVRTWEIYVSDDGKDWGEAVARGNWADDAAAKTVEFQATTGRFVMLQGLAERAGGPWMCVAEIEVLVQTFD
jgi:TolB-like protein